MTRLLRLALLVALAGLSAGARGQGVALVGGDVDLVVPVVGPGFGVAVDESTRLVWQGRWGRAHKLTVESVGGGQAYRLSVEAAVRAWFARGTGAVDLVMGAPPRDLVVNIHSPFQRDATLRYRATAAPSAAPGLDVHAVTYTLTAQ